MLSRVREEIDQIDREIAILLEKRYICVDEVVRIKKENGIAVLDATREKEMFGVIKKNLEHKEYEESIIKTFQSVVAISKDYQKNANR